MSRHRLKAEAATSTCSLTGAPINSRGDFGSSNYRLASTGDSLQIRSNVLVSVNVDGEIISAASHCVKQQCLLFTAGCPEGGESAAFDGAQAWAGQRLRLSIKGMTDGSLPTSFFVDEASIQTRCAE